ncbi:hypothetical protein D5F01_LYC24312 [Larimichthys crocea]|uniref:Helix-turn-helix domain-containing protein n=1 Tax=Larimichthys crocea TaxID=215358 RepID=A0A6G0HF71_LARCR|nr:hypothetical protein D5F01_LYC24312 [Larimichthys crocea]
MNILHEHYEHTILTLSNLTYNSTALQIATGWARKRYNTRLRIETLQTAEQIIHGHSNTITNTITNTTTSTSQATITYTKPPAISKTRQRLGVSLSPIPELSDEEEFPPLPAPHKTTVLSLGQQTTLSEHITNYNRQHQNRTPLLPTPTQPHRPDQTALSTHRLPTYKMTTMPPRTGPIIPRPQPPRQTQLPPPTQKPPNPHFTSPITTENKQTPPGPQTSTPQTSRQVKITDTINDQRPDLSPIPQTRNSCTIAAKPSPQPTPPSTTLTPPLNNRKIFTQAQIHRPPDQLNITPDLHSISLTTHSNSNVSILIPETISPLRSTPAGGADSSAGVAPQRSLPEQKEEGKNMMKGHFKAKSTGMKSQSEPSSKHSPGAVAVSHAGPEISPPANRKLNTSDSLLDSPPRQRTLTPILPGKFKPTYHLSRPNRKLQDWFFKGRKPVLPSTTSHTRLHTKVYFKTTDTHALLHKNSYHPKHTFRGIIKSQIIRFHRICSQQSDFNKATSLLFKALRNRAYSKRFLRQIKNSTLASLAPTRSHTPPAPAQVSVTTPNKKVVQGLVPNPNPYPKQGLHPNPNPYPKQGLHPDPTPHPNPNLYPRPGLHPYPNPLQPNQPPPLTPTPSLTLTPTPSNPPPP